MAQTIRFLPTAPEEQDGGGVKEPPSQLPRLITSFNASTNLLLASDIKRTVSLFFAIQHLLFDTWFVKNYIPFKSSMTHNSKIVH